MAGTGILITIGGIVIGLAIIGILLFLLQRKLEVKLNKFKLLAVGSAIGIPVFAIFWGMLDGETLSIIQAFWISTILVGIYLVNKH